MVCSYGSSLLSPLLIDLCLRLLSVPLPDLSTYSLNHESITIDDNNKRVKGPMGQGSPNRTPTPDGELFVFIEEGSRST